jgi:transposase
MARGRPATVFVRPLIADEKHELARIIRRGRRTTSSVTVRRALMVWRSAQGAPASEIARTCGAAPDRVREVIHAFNSEGMTSLLPRWGGGRPRRITQALRQEIVRIATTRPQLLKEPYTRWSLRTLRAYLLRTKVVLQISTERLREILHEEKVSIQRTRSWKRSPDPDFDAKAARVLELYHSVPDAVVCFDELGPVRPVPTAGWGWAPQARPKRLPANYKKPHGVRFFFGCYDVGADQLFGRWFANKGASNVLKTFRFIRRRYPGEVRIHIVMDNLSAHWTEGVLTWAEANNAELVPTPTYASWLNRIEPQFGVMVKLVIAGSDYTDHDEFQRSAAAFLRRRNHEARRDFEQRQRDKAKRRERWTARRRERLAREAATTPRAA